MPADAPRPFVYIASLRRTGSTVLAEALTSLPHCFIFREPHFGRNEFRIFPADVKTLRGYGVDLKRFKKRSAGAVSMLESFRDELIPQLEVEQVGVKEIFHDGWESYLACFPDARVVLTGRDPRDIYLSLHDRLESGRASWSGDFTPESVSEDLLREFGHQQRMVEATECLPVKYEDLCLDEGTIDRVKAFTGSVVPGIGRIGGFNVSHPRRRDEVELHGDRITGKRIARWRTEPDADLRAAAERTFDLMSEYCAFWGYEKD